MHGAIFSKLSTYLLFLDSRCPADPAEQPGICLGHLQPSPPSLESLSQQVGYCEEQLDCRRVMIMTHFGETTFQASKCHKTCDNCLNAASVEREMRDVSQVASHSLPLLETAESWRSAASIRCLNLPSFRFEL